MSGMEPTKPEALVFAPLPPEPNGIADYVAEQLPFLARRHTVTAVIADTAPTPSPQPAIRIIRLSRYLECRERWKKVPHIYHIGNNAGHSWMLPVALRHPGILVQHDGKLNYLFFSLTGTSESEISTQVAFAHYGGAARGLRLWEISSLSCARLLAERSLRIIVHSRYLAGFRHRDVPADRVTVIPHHLAPVVETLHPQHRPVVRERFGVPKDALLLVSAGFATRSKGIVEILDLMRPLQRAIPRLRYLIAGQTSDDIRDMIAARGLEKRVTVTGFLNNTAFYDALVAADIVLTLRPRYDGESSGVLARALGLGRACIINDVGAYAEIPPAVARKIPYRGFGPELFKAILDLAADADARARLEHAAREYAARVLDIRTTTDAYAEVIEKARRDLAERPVRVPEHTFFAGCLDFQTPQALAARLRDVGDDAPWHPLRGDAAHTLWWHTNLLPLGNGTILGIWGGDAHASLVARHLFDQRHCVFIDPAGLSGESHALLLVLLSGTAMRGDPSCILSECNRILVPGGVAVVNIALDPGDAVFHMGLQRRDWLTLAEAAGFDVLAFADAWGGGGMPLAPQETIPPLAGRKEMEVALRLRKVTAMVDRHPPRYYQTAFPDPLLLRPYSPSLLEPGQCPTSSATPGGGSIQSGGGGI